MQNRYPGGFNMLPPVVKNLLIINGILFLAKLVLGGQGMVELDRWLAFWHWNTGRFKLHQIFTYMFMHGDFVHLLFNMGMLWLFGSQLENAWGPKKFLNFYVICGLTSCGLFALMAYIGFTQFDVMLGASGAVYGLLVGFGMMYPNLQLMLIFLPIPMKAKHLLIMYIAFDVFYGFSGTNTGIAHFAHLGGALGGFLLMKFWIQKR